ncbi:MAG: Rossmann-like and DUF2520 domain-containing protein [Dehalococcoidia bacterium]
MTTAPAAATPEERRALTIGIIGAGRLGGTLAGALAAAGYTHVQVASRTDAHARAVADACGVAAVPVARAVEESALVFLGVPDGAIASLAETLPWRSGQGVVHLSGALGLDVLAGATGRYALAGCLHPIQTFPGVLAADDPREIAAALFRGVTCGLEAHAPLDGLLAAIAGDLGARTVRLEGVGRARYHAAAVLVSNDVVALMAAATRTWSAAGLPEAAAREALAPLLLAAAANAARLPPERALTGPVARGDVATVRRHLEALAGEPDLAALYRALARELARLDLGHAPEVSAALRAVLTDDAPED